jgi:hypothetical protein
MESGFNQFADSRICKLIFARIAGVLKEGVLA